MDTASLLRANAEAQARFAEMIDAKACGDPDSTEVRRYVQAERAVDRALMDLQRPALAVGDHAFETAAR